MFAEWRHAYANIALTGGNLFFLLIAVKLPTPAGLSLAAGTVGATSLYAWYANLRRYRAVSDTPTSRVSSAPQGYIELVGKGVCSARERLMSPLSALPCLWYRYLVEEKSGNKWHRIDSGVSSEVFGLNDGTGSILIDPNNAEIFSSNKQVRMNGNFRHTEWALIEGETLYVLGEHVTHNGSTVYLNARQDISNLLAEWKRDKKNLLKRFDLDSDGHISHDEWELARRAAVSQVEQAHQETRLQADSSMIKKPHGRLFLISNRAPEGMASRYLRWAWVHLGLLLAACLTIAMML